LLRKQCRLTATPFGFSNAPQSGEEKCKSGAHCFSAKRMECYAPCFVECYAPRFSSPLLIGKAIRFAVQRGGLAKPNRFAVKRTSALRRGGQQSDLALPNRFALI
jgi:hypothetical protein